MDLFEAIAGRRAVRNYTAEPVDERTLRRLIDAAIQAPSAVNQQPLTFTVVRDREVLDLVSREAKAHMRATMPAGPTSERLRARLDDPDFHIFYHAPVLILISSIEDGPWIVEDAALGAENLMLAAHARGLGSCWIGFAQSFLATATGRAALGLPEGWVPVAPIIVGHPEAAPPPVPRHDPVIHWVG